MLILMRKSKILTPPSLCGNPQCLWELYSQKVHLLSEDLVSNVPTLVVGSGCPFARDRRRLENQLAPPGDVTGSGRLRQVPGEEGELDVYEGARAAVDLQGWGGVAEQSVHKLPWEQNRKLLKAT